MPIKLWKIAHLYYECLQVETSPKKWGTKLDFTHKHDILSVYCFFFDLFHNADVCIFAKLLHCLIIYLYKTDPAFLTCPWNLRSIGSSDFKVLIQTFLFISDRCLFEPCDVLNSLWKFSNVGIDVDHVLCTCNSF